MTAYFTLAHLTSTQLLYHTINTKVNITRTNLYSINKNDISMQELYFVIINKEQHYFILGLILKANYTYTCKCDKEQLIW